MSTHMRVAWGKFDREKDSTHPLAQHGMDVAAVFTKMMRLPAVGDRLDEAAGTPLDNVQRHRLSVLVFLHDIGKLHPGFQAKGWPPGSWSAPMRGHLEEDWAFLTHAFRHSEHPFHGTMQRIATWGEAVSPLLAAATAHHGRSVRPPSDPTPWDTGVPPTPDYDWREEAQSIADALPRWFAEAFQGSADPLPSKAHFHHLIAGLAALADWIGSDRQRHRRRLGGQGERLAPRRGPHRLCGGELRG